jgi:hypothetical protein
VRVRMPSHHLWSKCSVYRLPGRTCLCLPRRNDGQPIPRRHLLTCCLLSEESLSWTKPGVRVWKMCRRLRRQDVRLERSLQLRHQDLCLPRGIHRRPTAALHAPGWTSSLQSRMWSQQPLRICFSQPMCL